MNNQTNFFRSKTLDPMFDGAFLDYNTRILYENELNYNSSTYKICQESVMSSFIVAYLSKNHYLEKEINYRITELKTNGILNFWIKKYTNFKNSKSASTYRPSALKMENLRGAFEILLYGLLISFAFMIIEAIITVVVRKKAFGSGREKKSRTKIHVIK